MATLEERGADPTRLQAIREFLEADTGSDFVMANFIELRDEPSARAELDRYMDGILAPLAWRACHPVLAGPVVGRPLDLWGLENAERWSLVALVRYRSRRDMIEIATDPAFQEAHPHKVAALERTIAIPSEPYLQLGSPRWLAALARRYPARSSSSRSGGAPAERRECEGGWVAEREGFEPPVPLRVHLISSQAHSTRLWHLSVGAGNLAERVLGLAPREERGAQTGWHETI